MKKLWSVALPVLVMVGCSKPTPTAPIASNNSQPAVESAAQATLPVFQVDPAKAGSVRGTIRYKGPKPEWKPLDMREDPLCSRGGTDAHDETLIVGKGGSLANTFVYIDKGLEGKHFATPSTSVVFDQKGCSFRPHIIGVQTYQTFEVTNSDPVTHNIHPMPMANTEWNHSQAPHTAPMNHKFTKQEVMIPIKCNVHRWMHAYVGVVDHPYFSVTQDDGRFNIPNLPPGTYNLTVWHESLGMKHATFTVTPHGMANVRITFEPK